MPCFLKFSPGPVASFLLPPPPPSTNGGRSSAAPGAGSARRASPHCAPTGGWQDQRASHSEPRPLPRGRKAGLLGFPRANWSLLNTHQQFRARSEYIKTRRPWPKPQSPMVSDWSVASRELAEKGFLLSRKGRMEIKLFSKYTEGERVEIWVNRSIAGLKQSQVRHLLPLQGSTAGKWSAFPLL